jgi:hypothetical protein
MTASKSNGVVANGGHREYKQSDEEIWKKVNKSLMNIGVPVTPILIRRAKGVSMFVRIRPHDLDCLQRDKANGLPDIQDSNDREILDFTR